MSVHPRTLPSGKKRYEVRWRVGDRNRSQLFDTLKAANAWEKELRKLRQSGDLATKLENRRVTIDDLITDWAKRSRPNLSTKGANNYLLQIEKRIQPTFGSTRVSQLTVRDIEQWIADMSAGGDNPPTILKACTALQAMLSMAVRDGIVAVNVVQQARKPSQSRTRRPYLIKPAQVEMIRAAMVFNEEPRDVVLLELLAYAGLRPESEAVALKWGDIRDRSLLVQDTKRGRERSVPMLATLQRTLTDWRDVCGNPPASALVVPTNTGRGSWTEHDWRNWRRREFLKSALAAGLPKDVRPRDLRGSFVSLLVHEGQDIVTVAGQVGHSPAICLRDYAQVFSEVDPNHRPKADDVIQQARAAAPHALAELRKAKEEAA